MVHFMLLRSCNVLVQFVVPAVLPVGRDLKQIRVRPCHGNIARFKKMLPFRVTAGCDESKLSVDPAFSIGFHHQICLLFLVSEFFEWWIWMNFCKDGKERQGNNNPIHRVL